MIKYSEQLSTPLKSPSSFKSASPTPSNDVRRITSGSEHDNRFSLTPLWEFVVRTKTLPDGLDLNVFFHVIHERLQNPEREVRQHALRVLSDVITVIDSATLDSKMQVIISDLVTNLGHIGPAVRKGAIDCLKVYLNCSNSADEILKDIVYKGVEKSTENKMKPTVVTGIIISLPFLIKTISPETLIYLIRVAFEKMVQITYQEVAVKCLVRIKGIIGEALFNEYADNNFKKDFSQLCEVDIESDIVIRKTQDEIIEDKVILETEIKLNSGPAITMQIHEESRQSITTDESDVEQRGSLGIVKVLTDDSEDYYENRRTPRRVRFGGEIVKLRTPDSDSNQPSDLDNDSTITITPREENQENSIIEIHYNDTKTSRTISHIPVSHLRKQKSVHSEPASPVHIENKTRKLSRSSPDLNNANVFGEKVSGGASKIPRRNEKSEKTTVIKDKKLSHTTTIQIKFKEPKGEIKEKKNAANQDIKFKEQRDKPTILDFENEDQKDDNCTSPALIHKEIEIFHNLTRSPEHKKAEYFFPDQLNETNAEPVDVDEVIQSEILPKNETATQGSSELAVSVEESLPSNNAYSSFQVCDTTNVAESIISTTTADSPIPLTITETA
ncbi:hypothetical protein FQA39_LY15869 [Lamprigera yunnana]|nr:hypothetical protein FQA39_LY15869 [Lamprigera yunnana]